MRLLQRCHTSTMTTNHARSNTLQASGFFAPQTARLVDAATLGKGLITDSGVTLKQLGKSILN